MSEPRSTSKQIFRTLFGGFAPNLRIAAGAKPARQLVANADARLRLGQHQGLVIGVYRNKLNAAQTFVDHAIDGISTAAANTNDFDLREVFPCYQIIDHNVYPRESARQTNACAARSIAHCTRIASHAQIKYEAIIHINCRYGFSIILRQKAAQNLVHAAAPLIHRNAHGVDNFGLDHGVHFQTQPQQSNAGAVGRILERVGDAGDFLRVRQAHRHIQYARRQIAIAGQLRTAAGDDRARPQQAGITGPFDFFLHQLKDLFEARFNHHRQIAARHRKNLAAEWLNRERLPIRSPHSYRHDRAGF